MGSAVPLRAPRIELAAGNRRAAGAGVWSAAGAARVLRSVEKERESGQPGRQRHRRAGAGIPDRRRPGGDPERAGPVAPAAHAHSSRHGILRRAPSGTLAAGQTGHKLAVADRAVERHGDAATQAALRRLLVGPQNVAEAVPDEQDHRLDLIADGSGDALRADAALSQMGFVSAAAAPAGRAARCSRLIQLQDRLEVRRRDAGILPKPSTT